MKLPHFVLAAALLLSLIAVGTWAFTDGHYYTKHRVVEEVEIPVDPNDPLAGAGFYDDERVRRQTVVRDEFHLGLLPGGMLDRNAISVVSIAGPAWALAVLFLWLRWRRTRKAVALAT